MTATADDTPRPFAEGLREVFQNTARLRVSAFLSSCAEAAFQAVQEKCGLSKSALSKQVSILEKEGLVDVRKGYVGKYPRTWLALTPEGREALAEHLATLQDIADTAAQHATDTNTAS